MNLSHCINKHLSQFSMYKVLQTPIVIISRKIYLKGHKLSNRRLLASLTNTFTKAPRDGPQCDISVSIYSYEFDYIFRSTTGLG